MRWQSGNISNPRNRDVSGPSSAIAICFLGCPALPNLLGTSVARLRLCHQDLQGTVTRVVDGDTVWAEDARAPR